LIVPAESVYNPHPVETGSGATNASQFLQRTGERWDPGRFTKENALEAIQKEMETRQQYSARAWVGYLLALGATLIWSGNFIVARGLHQMVSPAILAFLRWLIATLALLPLAAPSLWRERQVIRRNMGYLLLTAFLGVTVCHTLIYVAARSTSALNLSVIMTSSPISTLLVARILLGEELTLGRVMGIATAVLGIFVLLTRGDLSLLLRLQFSLGDLWMLLAAASFGAYTVLVRRKPEHLGQAAFLSSTFVLGLTLIAPWAAWEAVVHGLPNPSASLLGSVLYIGLGASLASYFLWNKAIATIGPTRCGFIQYTLPIFSGMEAFLFLGEPVGWVHAVASLLIFGGIILATRSKS
jgi:drug/metabolite transporter (DMT)-like permease